MQILYLWIEKHGIIQKQGFNFGGPYRFELTETPEGKRKLLFEPNDSYIDNFFDSSFSLQQTGKPADYSNAQIRNVTAIIGKNGTGKTSLLDYIKTTFASPSDEINVPRSKRLLVIETSDRQMKILIDPSIGLTNLGELEKHFQLEELGPGPFSEQEFFKNSQTSLIFFSNIFDGHDEYETDAQQQFYNISTNYLVKADKIKLRESNRLID